MTADAPRGDAPGGREPVESSALVALGEPGPGRALAEGRARPVAIAFGGRVELRPDGAIVVNVPGTGSARDRARRAARCALSLRDVLGDEPLALLLVPTEPRAGDATVARAKAMAAQMPPASAHRARLIAIDETIAGLLDARFEIVRHGEAFGLRREKPGGDAEAPRTLLGKPAPFVGRERELSTLEAVLRGCLDDGGAHTVLVTGPSGVGKSRLQRELVRGVLQRREGVEVWLARADPMSAGSPLSMIAQLVRAAAGIVPSDTLRARQTKLSARVTRTLPAADAVRVAEFLGELSDIRYPEARSAQLLAARRSHALMGDQLRRAWQDFLAAECAAQPVLVILEDLHWGDLPTVGFFDGALRQLRDAPLMVVALGQPEVHKLFPDLWSSHPRTELRLGELSRKASERLVREVLGEGLAAAEVGRIVTQSAGNAFYLEELIRAAVSGQTGLPGTVLAMVKARLDALDPDARRVLRAASVFGATFWKGGVAALLEDGPGERRVQAWLDELLTRELLVQREAGRFPDELAFRHDLVRAASYEGLTEEGRALGHRLAAAWLEGAGEGDAMALAEHLERGGAHDRARAWFARAASQALEGNDYAGALARADRALACDAAGVERGELLALQAEAQRWTSDFEGAARRLEEASALLRVGSSRWYDVTSELVAARARTGHAGDTAELVARLVDTSATSDAAASRVIAWARAAVALVFAGAHGMARSLFARIDREGLEPADGAPLGRVLQARATRAMAEGDLAAYLEHTAASVRAFDAVGDVRTACVQRNNAGYALVLMGAVGKAETTLREAMVAADRMGMTSAAAIARQNLGLALAYAGALQEARAVEERGIEATVASGETLMTACGQAYLAEILSIGGNHAAAERAARAALDLVGETGHEIRATALAALGRVLLSTRREAEALQAAEQGLSMLPALGSASAEAALRLVHAEASRATGDEPRARQLLSEAAARLQERAAKIRDDDLRRSFLEGVPAHARTLALAAEWRASP